MVDTRNPTAREMDIDRPCAARILDAFLGGSHNFGSERGFAERLERELPDIGESYRENRAFVQRAVEYLLDHGVRQFLDLGSGIPTIGHVHEVARRRTRDFRVLYVDNEPLTVAHSKPLLAGDARTEIIQADCRDPKSILHSPEAVKLLDLDEPVGLLLAAALHFVPDSDDPVALLESYRDALVPGSHLVISHLTGSHDPDIMRTVAHCYAGTADPLHPRDTGWIEKAFGNFEILPPGATYLADWRPEPGRTATPRRYHLLYGGVARKH